MTFPNIVNIAISRGNIAVSRLGFGVTALMHYHTKTTLRMISCTSSEDLISSYAFSRSVDADAALLAKVDQVFSQSPRPSTLKIGRLALAPTQVHTLTVQTATTADKIEIEFMGTAISFTSSGTAATDATALAVAINAIRVGSAAAVGAVVTVTGTAAGVLYHYAKWNRFLKIKNTSTDPGIATDLGNIFAFDPDFFGFDLVDDAENSVKAAGGWAETNKRLFLPTCCDSEMRDPSVTTDVASDLQDLEYDFTGVWYSGKDNLDGKGIALFATLGAAFNPGEETFAHKGLTATLAEDSTTLLTSEIAALEAKNCNFYAPYLGLATTWPGKVASGEWIDTTRGLAWLESEMQASVFETIRGAEGKVPFTNLGIDFAVNPVKAVLARATEDPSTGKKALLASSPAPAVTFPDVSAVTTANKALRKLPDIKWTATLAGAIHETEIRGTVSV